MQKLLLLVWSLSALGMGQVLSPGQGIEQTMARLESSNRGVPQTVRILFYGQSITKQDWWRLVAEDLRRRYPNADLRIENRAIGGYSTPYLVRTMQADILPFHPDLIVLHDYGSEDLYEHIIRWIRTHTSAEVLLQSDHIVWLPGEEDSDGSRRRSFDFQQRHSFDWLPALARKYGLGLVDIRGGWRDHLKQNQFNPRALLRDSVHLNAGGESLYARLTSQYFVAIPPTRPQSLVREVHPEWKDGRLELDFEGTRIEIEDLEGGPLDVWIDGKRPGQMPGLFYHSRPTNTWDADWPMVMKVGNENPQQPEEWVLKVTERNTTGTSFSFELYGSVTGFDGKGSSSERFVSKSGRVVLDPQDYDVERSFGLHKIPMPGGWQIRWSSLARFLDPVLPHPGTQTILYGLTNQRHQLTLVAPPGTSPRLRKLRIYQPAMKEN